MADIKRSEWVLDEKALEKRYQRLLKRLAHEEYEKRVSHSVCKAIERKGKGKFIVCGKKSCDKQEHLNCCKAILNRGNREGEICNVVNCPIKAHKNPKVPHKESKWNQFVKEHWDDVNGDFKEKIRKLSDFYKKGDCMMKFVMMIMSSYK